MCIMMCEGPTKEGFVAGSMHFGTFTYDFYCKIWLYCSKHKSEFFTKFKLWETKIEN